MKNLYKWLIIILNVASFMFITNKFLNIIIHPQNNYYTTSIFCDLFIGASLTTLFIFNTCYVLCSGYGWLPLYIKRKTLEEEKRIQELLQKKENIPSNIFKLLRWLLVIGNILGLVLCIDEYYCNMYDSYADTTLFLSYDATILFFVFVFLFVSNIFYILYNRTDFPNWLLLVIKRKRIEEEKRIKELKD